MRRPRGAAQMSSQAGFGLIELLTVLGILALVLAAVHGLYLAHQRSATTETEAVDVQQNLRIAMDQISKDISMAGFMTNGANPIAAVANGAAGAPDTVTLNSGSEALVAATVNSADTMVTVAAGNFLDLAVMAFGASIGGFEAAADQENLPGTPGAKVRIVNYRGEVLGAGARFTVIEVKPTAGACGAVPAPCLRLRADNAGTGIIIRGDTIVKTSVIGGAEAFPQTVQYSVAACPAPLAGNCLMRTTVPVPTGGATVVATNVTDLQFSYLLSGNVESAAPTATQMSSIRAVRVTLSGQLVDTVAVAGGNPKTRTLSSIVAMRNV